MDTQLTSKVTEKLSHFTVVYQRFRSLFAVRFKFYVTFIFLSWIQMEINFVAAKGGDLSSLCPALRCATVNVPSYKSQTKHARTRSFLIWRLNLECIS